jgi:hypothetical protein
LNDDVQNEKLAFDRTCQDASSKDVVTWATDAEEYLQRAPEFICAKIRNSAEKKALELGLKEISRNFIENLRK